MFAFEYKMITTVALVRNIDHSTTKITYELEDLTGTIPGHYWIEENDSQQKNIQLNTYVRVVGSLRSTSGTKSIMIFNIHPVSGINELNTHLLEVINARYLAEEYSRGGGENEQNQLTKMEVDTAVPDDIDGLRGKDRTILDVIRTFNSSDTGCNRAELIKRFPNIPAREISTILDAMVSNGHIYTTVDQDHFQACF
jgi:replication factor A2